jgi:hypothetical protein
MAVDLLLLGTLATIAATFAAIAQFVAATAEEVRARRVHRHSTARDSAPIYGTIEDFGLIVREARLVHAVDADGAPCLTLALTFSPARSTQAAPVSTSPAREIPQDVTVVALSGQPLHPQTGLGPVRQVSGDGFAGFFELERPGRHWPAGMPVEVYGWGRLTAGVALRTLWLLLFPFQLANVAMWMSPEGKTGRLIQALCRLFALAITVAFVMAIVSVSLDLFVWQCGSAPSACPQARQIGGDDRAAVGQQLAYATALPLAALIIVWALASRTWRRYERFDRPDFEGMGGQGLGSAEFWNDRHVVGRLRAIHVAAALVAIDLVVLRALARFDGSVRGAVLTWVAGGLLVACAAAVCTGPVVARAPRDGWSTRAGVLLRVAAIFVTGLTIWHAAALPAATLPAVAAAWRQRSWKFGVPIATQNFQDLSPIRLHEVDQLG